VVSLKQAGTTAWDRDMLQMSEKMPASWSAHTEDTAMDAIWASGFVSIHSRQPRRAEAPGQKLFLEGSGLSALKRA
jgi:hypothetical protein